MVSNLASTYINNRQKKVLESLNSRTDKVSIKELATILSVSEQTIRRDFDHLAEMDLIIRSRGGAKINSQKKDLLFGRPSAISYWMEKSRIGKVAAELVEDGDLIAVNSGTTVMAFINSLWNKNNLRIVLSDYEIARMISYNHEFDVTITGGKLQQQISNSGLTGRNSVDVFKSYYFDKCFVGVLAVNPVDGLMTSLTEYADTTRAIIQNSKTKILMTDSSKFGKTSGTVITSFDTIDILITDEGVKNYPKVLERIEELRTMKLIIC